MQYRSIMGSGSVSLMFPGAGVVLWGFLGTASACAEPEPSNSRAFIDWVAKRAIAVERFDSAFWCENSFSHPRPRELPPPFHFSRPARSRPAIVLSVFRTMGALRVFSYSCNRRSRQSASLNSLAT